VPLVVARTAERTKIVLVVRPTTGQRKYVVNLRCRGEPAGLKAVLAKRMRSDVPATDFQPISVILFDDVRIALVLIVFPTLGQPMHLAVLPGG
jgi:mRNA-degrading endonuclease toxin of MazEF toxin-antitoxin module